MTFAVGDLFRFWPTKPNKPSTKPEQTGGKADRDSVNLGERSASFLTDAIAVAQFAGSGFLYKEAAKDAAAALGEKPPLSDAPVVKLEDPFLIAPGWTTLPEKFDNLIAHLLKSPENGERAVYLKEGNAFQDQDCTQPTEIRDSDKIFVAVYDDVLSPPPETAAQVDRAVSMIKAVHGEKVDVLGYSMGGLAVRKMLDTTEQTVDQVAYLGTAHRGTRFAALANYVIRRDINFAMKLGNLHAGHLPAMQWMLPEDPEGTHPNPNLVELNSPDRLAKQRKQATEMLNIGSRNLATITKPWGGTEGGDGLVQNSSVQLDGVPTVLLDGRGTKQHGFLPSDTKVFLELTDFFGWKA